MDQATFSMDRPWEGKDAFTFSVLLLLLFPSWLSAICFHFSLKETRYNEKGCCRFYVCFCIETAHASIPSESFLLDLPVAVQASHLAPSPMASLPKAPRIISMSSISSSMVQSSLLGCIVRTCSGRGVSMICRSERDSGLR